MKSKIHHVDLKKLTSRIRKRVRFRVNFLKELYRVFLPKEVFKAEE